MKRLANFPKVSLGITALTLLFAPQANAASGTWNNTGTNWNANGSWSAAFPQASGDTATFNSVKVTDPNISASISIAALNFSTTSASGYDITSSGTLITLTLNGTTPIQEALNISGTNTINAPIVLNNVSAQTFQGPGAGGALVINGKISSTNANQLNLFEPGVAAGGTIRITGTDNSYSGGTLLPANDSGAVVQVSKLGDAGANGSLGTGAITIGSLTNHAAPILNYVGSGETSSKVINIGASRTSTTSVSTIDTTGATGALHLTGDIAAVVTGGSSGGNLTLKLVSASTFGDSISGAIGNGTGSTAAASLALQKAGAGSWTLSGANTYTGTTTVSAGTLNFAKQQALYNSTTANWTPTKITVASGATLALGVGTSPTYFDSTALDTFLNSSHMGLSTTTTGFKSGAILGFDTTNATSGTFTYNSNITNFGTSLTDGIAKLGVGTLILGGTNSYTGVTTINGGTLQLAKKASLYNSTTGSWIPANITVASGATLAMNVGGTNEFAPGDVDTLLGNISVANTSTQGLQAGSKIGFDTTNALGGKFTQGNVIANSTGGSGGAVGVVKLGTNTLELNKTNTYTGSTTVAAGTLLVTNNPATGSGTGSGAVTVQSGATLAGSGKIGGAATFDSNSILSPGNSVGTLTFASSLTLNNNTTGSLRFDLGTSSDKVLVGGLLTLNGQDFTSFTFDTSGVGFGPGTYVLFDASSAIGGSLGTVLTSTQFTGYNATLSLDSTNNDFILTVAVVPEPGTWALMFGGLALLLIVQRGKNKVG